MTHYHRGIDVYSFVDTFTLEMGPEMCRYLADIMGREYRVTGDAAALKLWTHAHDLLVKSGYGLRPNQ